MNEWKWNAQQWAMNMNGDDISYEFADTDDAKWRVQVNIQRTRGAEKCLMVEYYSMESWKTTHIIQ